MACIWCDLAERPPDTTKLMECPFCGSEAAHGNTKFSNKGEVQEYRYFISCIVCGVNNRSVGGGYTTPMMAAQHWNHRK